MPEVPMKPDEGAAEQAGDTSEQGGITQALVETDKNLFKISQIVAQNPQIPDEIKSAFQSALDSYRQGLSALTGGGGQAGPANATPEQGASGAQPMSMQRPG